MGIQSTITLSREKAEALYIKKKKEEMHKQFKAQAGVIDTDALEYYLESEFYNYSIID